MTAFKNIGEVMHLVTHTYTVQTFASAVNLLTNYHFRTIGSRQHTHTLCLLKNTDLQCSNLCKRIFFFKVAAFLHSFNCRFALPLNCCSFCWSLFRWVCAWCLERQIVLMWGQNETYIFFWIKNTSVAWCPWSLGAPGQLPSCPYG